MTGVQTCALPIYVTRSELVVLAVRAFTINTDKASSLTFDDNTDIPDWALQSINAALKNGIVSGYDDNTFKPFNSVTRGEASKIIYQCYTISKKI